MEVYSIKIHQLWDQNNLLAGHDLALVKLKYPWQMSNLVTVEPICLLTKKRESFEG